MQKIQPFQVSLCLLLSVWPALSATVAGRVTDESGAAVRGAKVFIRQNGNTAYTTDSGSDGGYSFGNVASGRYFVECSAPNLQVRSPLEIVVKTNSLRLDIELIVADKKEEVEVSGTTTVPTVSIESANNAGATVIRGKDLEALADNPDDLQSDLQAMAGPGAGPSGGSMYIDGFSSGQTPPKEAIREVRLNQDPFAPEFDKFGMGRVEIITKAAERQWHGSAGFNFADDLWNTRNPYSATKAPLLLRESENTLGGPLAKRASFFLDVERHTVDNGSIVNGVVLDSATLQPTAYNSVVKAIQRRWLVSPRIDVQWSDRNTSSFLYSLVDSSVANAGIGQFDLPSRGYGLENRFDTFQASDSYAGATFVNEIRYQFYRWRHETNPNGNAAAIQVLGAFTDGGAQVGRSSDVLTSHELQETVSTVRGNHALRFGMRLREGLDNSISRASFNGLYTFSSIQAFQITEEGLRQGWSTAAIRAAGGGASQYSVTTGEPSLRGSQFDAGLFVGDSWHLRPNVLISMGLRYENQTNLQDHANWGPRMGVAWSPRQGSAHSTVIRGGFGIFYDRFALGDTLTAQRYNGIVQQRYVITNPDTYPQIPPASLLGELGNPQILQGKDPNLKATYLLQSALTVEQQINARTTVSASYINSRGVHVLRSLDVNAPLPGTGTFPLGFASPTYLMTSSGIYNQNQLMINVSTKPMANLSIFSYYVLNRALSNSDGLTTFPANPYNYTGEYGPAATDIRHRLVVGGSWETLFGLRLSPNLTLQSGAPFDITTGQDLFGTALFNTRPSVASGPGAGIVATDYGYLNLYPGEGEAVLSRNAGRGPGQIMLNLRLNRTFTLGGRRAQGKTEGRYQLTCGLSARNLLNHNNPGPIIGTVTSPLFGMSNQTAGGPNAEGFSEAANNRRLELQVRFSF